MNSRRFKFLWMPLAVVTAATTVAACTSSASPSSKGTGSTATATFTTIGYTTVITPGAPENPFNATNNVFPTFDAMQLGWSDATVANPNQEIPGLAASWTLSPDGTALTVNLQPGAKWSDGKPVTATDVKDSAAIWFAEGTLTGDDIASVTVDSPTQVTFAMTPGAHNQLFESDVLGGASGTAKNWIVPSFEYGKLLPASIWSTITASQGTGAAAKAATATLTSLTKTIDAYAPTTDISAGPFSIKRLNNSSALLVKNPDFYAASNVHVGQVIMEHYSTASSIADMLQSSTLDAAPFSALTAGEVAQAEAAGNKSVTVPAQASAALVFDENDAPYNNVKVRQALAYLINRPEIQKIAEPVVGLADPTITGVAASTLGGLLNSQQQSALNPYAPSTATATTLLKSAGLTLKGGAWYLPDGKPWTINIPVPSGFSDWLAASSAIKSTLTSFGIPTTITGEGQWPVYQPIMFKGTYPIGWWITSLGGSDWFTFQRVYGTYDGYANSASGSDARFASGVDNSDNFINSPSTVTVPGVGTVNPGQLNAELGQLNLASPAGLTQQQQISAQLVETINYEVPILQLWDYTDSQFVNDKRFGDWPTNSGVLGQDPGVWMAQGYVQPS
jgi:peptide/nickel transport system substrate-binding protein